MAEIITDEQVINAQEFFKEVCEKHRCVFAVGYVGLQSKQAIEAAKNAGELPLCSRKNGRAVLLTASQRGDCPVAAVLAKDEQSGDTVYLDNVKADKKGVGLTSDTWAGVTDISSNPHYVVTITRRSSGRGVGVDGLRKKGNIFTRFFSK